VLSTSVDGFTAGTPLEVLLDGRAALVAVGMNGQPLPANHGSPARLVTPGLYGFVGATKWLNRLTVTRFADQQAYWTRRGWAPKAPIKTAARIDVPRDGAAVGSGPLVTGGVAWAPHRGISAVEVRLDDGAWQRATLGPDLGLDYWRQWYVPVEPSPGRHQLTVRATDGDGATQTETRADGFPDGATGWHTVGFTAG